MCGARSAEAITYWQTGNMFMCPNAFNIANYKTSLKSMRTSTAQVEWKDVRSLPGTFLHEMMHFLDLKPHGKAFLVLGVSWDPINKKK